MYKVGVMLMGKPSQSPKKVKEIIIEVEAKTKVSDILSYLIQLNRIQEPNVNVAIQKQGRPVSESSTIAQILRHTKPINNVIKLFLYEIEDQMTNDLNNSTQKIVFEPTKKEKHKEMLAGDGKNKQMQNKDRQTKEEDEPKKGFCCC